MIDLARLASKHTNLVLRERTLRSVRRFFRERDFLEVATPLVNPSLIPEDHIHAVETEAGFLLPSPEIHMKRFLAAGYDRVFQIGPCFRKGERGEQHLPEFIPSLIPLMPHLILYGRSEPRVLKPLFLSQEPERHSFCQEIH